jgi:IS30 family transposase
VTKCTKIGRVENGAVQLHLSESQRSSIKPGVLKKLSVEEIAEQFLLF